MSALLPVWKVYFTFSQMIWQTKQVLDYFHPPTKTDAKIFSSNLKVKIKITKCSIKKRSLEMTLAPDIDVIQRAQKIESCMPKPEMVITICFHDNCWAAFLSLELLLPCHWAVLPLDIHRIKRTSHPINAMFSKVHCHDMSCISLCCLPKKILLKHMLVVCQLYTFITYSVL